MKCFSFFSIFFCMMGKEKGVGQVILYKDGNGKTEVEVKFE
jgi:hypothetical protein